MRCAPCRISLWHIIMMASDVHVLFTWGANSYGQLGSGSKDDTLLPTKSALSPSIAKDLQQVVGGGGHSVLLTGTGQVYVCGWNKSGQLGLPSPEDVVIPRLLLGLPKITKLSCGWNHTLAISESGSVLVWGSNVFGQLGTPEVGKQTEKPVELPSQVFSQIRVTDVSAGLRHSLAVTDDGKVYSWGDDKKGQLGHGRSEVKIQPTPKCVESLASTRCKGIAAGAYHSIAVTENGKLLSWGLNQHGQCACGYWSEDMQSQVSILDAFKLSDSRWITHVYRPMMIRDLPPIAEAHCGWSHTVAVSALMARLSLARWRVWDTSVLLYDSLEGQTLTCTVEGLGYRCTIVYSLDGQTLTCTVEGLVCRNVFAWGRSDYGQLGLVDIGSHDQATNQSAFNHKPREISALRGVKQMACGSEHNIALSASNHVVTFGWNEHGMCGTGDETNVCSPHVVECLKDWEPLTVGVGAGHSFVIARTRT